MLGPSNHDLCGRRCLETGFNHMSNQSIRPKKGSSRESSGQEGSVDGG